MIRSDSIWYYVICYDMIRYDMIPMTCCDMTRYDTIWYDTIRYNNERRYNTICYATLRYETIRYNTILYDMIRDKATQHSGAGCSLSFASPRCFQVYLRDIQDFRELRAVTHRGGCDRITAALYLQSHTASWIAYSGGIFGWLVCVACLDGIFGGMFGWHVRVSYLRGLFWWHIV